MSRKQRIENRITQDHATNRRAAGARGRRVAAILRDAGYRVSTSTARNGRIVVTARYTLSA